MKAEDVYRIKHITIEMYVNMKKSGFFNIRVDGKTICSANWCIKHSNYYSNFCDMDDKMFKLH